MPSCGIVRRCFSIRRPLALPSVARYWLLTGPLLIVDVTAETLA
jgi:hypothetical protein